MVGDARRAVPVFAGETGDARGGDVARAVVGGIVVERRRGGRARRRLGRMLGGQRGVGRGRGGGRLARRRGADPPGARGGIVAHLEPLQSRDDVLRGRHRAGAARDWAGGGRTIREVARVPITAGPRETAFPRRRANSHCYPRRRAHRVARRPPANAQTRRGRPFRIDSRLARTRASPSHPPGRPTLASRDPLPRTSIGRHVGLQVPEARAPNLSRRRPPSSRTRRSPPPFRRRNTRPRSRTPSSSTPSSRCARAPPPAVPPNCRGIVIPADPSPGRPAANPIPNARLTRPTRPRSRPARAERLSLRRQEDLPELGPHLGLAGGGPWPAAPRVGAFDPSPRPEPDRAPDAAPSADEDPNASMRGTAR